MKEIPQIRSFPEIYVLKTVYRGVEPDAEFPANENILGFMNIFNAKTFVSLICLSFEAKQWSEQNKGI